MTKNNHFTIQIVAYSATIINTFILRKIANRRARLGLLREYRAIGWGTQATKTVQRDEKRAKMMMQRDRSDIFPVFLFFKLYSRITNNFKIRGSNQIITDRFIFQVEACSEAQQVPTLPQTSSHLLDYSKDADCSGTFWIVSGLSGSLKLLL